MRHRRVHPRHAEGFEWDEGNEGHLADKKITSSEAEEVFDNGPVWAQNKKGMSGDFVMYGMTHAGRALMLVVNCDENRSFNRVITGRECNEGERTKYIK